MPGKCEQGKEGEGRGIFVFVLTKTKFSNNKKSSGPLRKRIKFVLLVKRIKKYISNISNI